MRMNLTCLKSDRTFKVGEYQVSHGQLLIRSPKAPSTGATPEFLTNIDLVFVGVDYMAVPRSLRGLEILAPLPEEILGKPIPPDGIKILASEGKRFPIVASSLSLFENDWDIFESPFEFRSQYRSTP